MALLVCGLAVLSNPPDARTPASSNALGDTVGAFGAASAAGAPGEDAPDALMIRGAARSHDL